MPTHSPRPCAMPGCPRLVGEGSRCAEHRLPARARESARASASARGYGSAWAVKRDAWIKAHPLCADPRGAHPPHSLVRAKIVDHIVPLRQGGKDDDSNYQSLCMTCHNYKTAHDGSRRGAGAKV